MFGLRESIDMIFEEGMNEVFARHARNAQAVREAVAVWCSDGPMEFNAIIPEQRSNSITCIRTPATSAQQRDQRLMFPWVED